MEKQDKVWYNKCRKTTAMFYFILCQSAFEKSFSRSARPAWRSAARNLITTTPLRLRVSEFYRQADFPEGRLCETEKYMDNLDVVLPLAVEYDSMPDTDFAYCCLSGFVPVSLIREEALQKMINAGAVSKEDFEPVMCTDSKNQSLLIQECDDHKKMGFMLENKEHFEKLRLELASRERPEFVPSEKEVLVLLKKYKKEYSEYLNRPITKILAEKVENSLYRPLLPYYRVGCGGRLAEDTYEYFT